MDYKKQHYLSQFYLKGFGKSNLNPKKNEYHSWIYFLDKKTVKLKATRNYAYEPFLYSKIDKNDVYDHSLEKYFGDLENEMKILVRDLQLKAEKREKGNYAFNLETKDKILLILFIFWSLKKTPSFLESIEQEIIQKLNEENESMQLNNDAIRLAKNYSIDLISNLDGNDDIFLFNLLFNKNIYFLISSDKSSFITTDNPVVVFNPKGKDGVIYESSEIYFPLSKSLLVMLHERGNKIRVLKSPNSKKQREINCYVASKAHKLIISKDRELLIKILKELKYEYA